MQNTKKIRTQNVKNTKYKENTNSKMSQRANPMFTLEIRKQIAKKYKTNQLYFPNPAVLILYFWIVLFSFS